MHSKKKYKFYFKLRNFYIFKCPHYRLLFVGYLTFFFSSLSNQFFLPVLLKLLKIEKYIEN